MIDIKKKQKVTITDEIVQESGYVSKNSHVFLALLPPFLALFIARVFSPLVTFFMHLNPHLEEELWAIDHEKKPFEYVALGFGSYFFFGGVLGFLIWFLAINNGRPENVAILGGFGTWFACVFLLTFLLVKMPTSQLQVKAIVIDRYLIYGLKEMVLHSNAGASLYESMVSVSNAGYGELSTQFDWAVRKVNTGASMLDTLNEMVKKTKSKYFIKVIWQLVNTTKTGSDLRSMIQPIIDELDNFQKAQIQNYARELNLWSLVYMIFSAAIPTIGSTMLVVLSVFANFGVDEFFFGGFAAGCLLLQIGLIFLVGKRRPNVIF